MDLCENPLNGNQKYVRPVTAEERDVVIPELEGREERDVEVMDTSGDLDVSILSNTTIEVSTKCPHKANTTFERLDGEDATPFSMPGFSPTSVRLVPHSTQTG